MKKINTVFAPLLSLCMLAAIIFTSCTKDNCKGVLCQNGGTCMQGSCQCPTGYYGNFCEQSTIVYVNNTYTEMTITVNNTTQQLSAWGGFASFYGNAGGTATVSAFTSGLSDSGTQVGELVTWAFTNTFPTSGAGLTVPINVPDTYFYLKMANADQFVPSYNMIKVNCQQNCAKNCQRIDSISLPNNGTIHGIGYYKKLSNTQVYVASSLGNDYILNPLILGGQNAISTVVVP